jgi:hypothetical protein
VGLPKQVIHITGQYTGQITSSYRAVLGRGDRPDTVCIVRMHFSGFDIFKSEDCSMCAVGLRLNCQ